MSFRCMSCLALVLFGSLLSLCVEAGPRDAAYSQNDLRRRSLGRPLGALDTPPLMIRDETLYDSGLHSRDVCSDAFPGRVKQTCSPSNTLCCIIPGESRPACVDILGFGFCCTEEIDCFVDIKSACGDVGANECAPGICCPANTNCVDNFKYTNKTLVRCNADRNLIPGYTATASTADPTATKTRTRTRNGGGGNGGSATAASEINANTDGDSPALGGGAIAGIVIGAVAAIVIVGALAWFCLSRRRKGNEKVAETWAPQDPYPEHPPQYRQEIGGTQINEAPNEATGFHPGDPKERYARTEMPAEARRQELP